MDKDSILQEFQTGERDDPRFLLSDGRTVVGEMVDENNHLWYIIKGDEGYVMEDAQGKEIKERLKQNEVVRRVRSNQ